MKTLSYEIALMAEMGLYLVAHKWYKYLAISRMPLSMVGLCSDATSVQAMCDSEYIPQNSSELLTISFQIVICP